MGSDIGHNCRYRALAVIAIKTLNACDRAGPHHPVAEREKCVMRAGVCVTS